VGSGWRWGGGGEGSKVVFMVLDYGGLGWVVSRCVWGGVDGGIGWVGCWYRLMVKWWKGVWCGGGVVGCA